MAALSRIGFRPIFSIDFADAFGHDDWPFFFNNLERELHVGYPQKETPNG